MSSASPYVLRIDPTFLANPAPRLELRDFVKSPERLTLFVRAFNNVQDRPASRLDSFARIASIHGSPVPFDGFDPAPNDNEPFRGYCQHGSQQFGPWHRPYLMMLEQALYAEVNKVAAEYTEPNYGVAAKAFRLPYWDWGLRIPGNTDWLPDIMSTERVQITLPDGSKTMARNPVFSFTISSREDRRLLGIPSAYATSVRRPTVQGRVLKSNNAEVETTLGRVVGNLRSELVLLLKNPASYACISNHTAKPRSLRCSQEENIESLHDNLHGLVGGQQGNMAAVEYAAYDPAFWLHHCNVDRLLALWEGIYPTEKIQENLIEQPGIGSDVQITPAPTTSKDPFYPFRKTATTWWTAQDVMGVYDPSGAGTRRLGYYYPEFTNQKVTPQQLLDTVDALYNDNPNTRRVFLNMPAIDTSQVPGSFNLRVGVQPDIAPAPGTRALPTSAVHAGTVCLFKRLDPSRCDNCSKQTPLQRANLDITDALAKVQRDAPSSWNNLKLHLEAVPLGINAAVQAGVHVPIGDATIFTVVDGVITSRVEIHTGDAAQPAAAGTRDLPQQAAAPRAVDDTLPTVQLGGLKAKVQLVQRVELDMTI